MDRRDAKRVQCALSLIALSSGLALTGRVRDRRTRGAGVTEHIVLDDGIATRTIAPGPKFLARHYLPAPGGFRLRRWCLSG
jgi:hypothetical protein